MQAKRFLVSGKAKLIALALVVALATPLSMILAQEPQPTPNEAPSVSIETFVVVLPIKATASDDGLPAPPGKLTYQWSFIEGPGPVWFGNSRALETFVVLFDYGTYHLRFTAFDGELSSYDDKLIHVVDDSAVLPVVEED